MEWISTKERLPSKEEQEKHWKFLVSNREYNWSDAAYFDKGNIWRNGECEVIPTHWKYLPDPPKTIK